MTPSYFIPSLKEICAQVIAQTFPDQKDIDPLRELDPNLYLLIIDQLAVDLPLTVTVPRVREADYWKACAEYVFRGRAGELHQLITTYGGLEGLNNQWKRLYLEHHLSNYILTQLPSEAITEQQDTELHAKCSLCASEVQGLQLPHLRCHINVVDLFARLPHLKSLMLSFGTLNAGIMFTPDMVGMRDEDANRIQTVLKSNAQLTSLSLPENAISGDLCRAIVAGLVRNKTLKHLDLSHNHIEDSGAHALGVVLLQKDIILDTLKLHDNGIGPAGAIGLGQALSVNKSLKTLTLSLNRMGDEGGKAIFAGLATNKSVTCLDLSCNELSVQAAEACADALAVNKTLIDLIVFGNNFGEVGGRILADAVESSTELRSIDVRQSNVSPGDEERLSRITRRRTTAQHMKAVEAEAEARRKVMESRVRDRIVKSFGPGAVK